MNNYDYIVLGGGVIGMTTARELAKRGASVAIFDRGILGMEASWAAGGILSSMRPWQEHPDSAELSRRGKALYPDYCESLKDETGIDPGYFRSGLIVIDQDHIDRLLNWAQQDKEIQCIDIDNLPAAINLPQISVLLPEIAQIRPPRLIAALCKSLKLLSVDIFEESEVKKIITHNSRFTGVVFDKGSVSAGSLIITAGAWCNSILKNINREIRLKPVHGQMLCLKLKQRELISIILDGGHYLIPRLDGHILVGSTMEDTGFNKCVTETAYRELFDWAISIYPDINKATLIKHWSGLRPASGDQKPFIGSITGYENIYINAGHFRKGILQAPVSAKLLVDHLAGITSFMSLENFNPSRVENSLKIA